MPRTNPLAAEVIRGLAGRGAAQHAYLNYLFLQAIVLLVWWPKGGLVDALHREEGPDTLVAVLMAVGVTVAYYSLRAGAEEILLPGQHPLREWTVATPLATGRILRGYLAGHLVQVGHALAMSSPLVLAAFSVAGGGWTALGWVLATVVFQSTFYRLVGAVLYMSMGHHGAMSFVVVRAALLLGYAVAGSLLPSTSHLVVTSRLLGGAGDAAATPGGLPPHAAFLLVYALLAAALAAVLHRQLSRHRPRAGADAVAGAG